MKIDIDRVETISEAAEAHGLDAENLVAQLNTIIRSDSI